jgi:uncharacterized protein YhfF
MSIPDHLRAYWDTFALSVGGIDETRFYDASAFGDSEALAQELAELILNGTKRATAGSVWGLEAANQRCPQRGDLSIITNWAGTPLCVIETTQLDVVPFDQVSAEFAAIEGEGDGSLAYWQEVHTAFFSRECARADRVFTPDMLVACERFKVVYV